MTEIARCIIEDELAIYHVMAGFNPLGFHLDDVEKDFFVATIKKLSRVYFTKVFGFCLMDHHFQLIVQMMSGTAYSDDDIIGRYKILHDNEDVEPFADQISSLKRKWSKISEFVKEIKQRFSLCYNDKHPGHVLTWGDHFTRALSDKGKIIFNSLAYIDLHPVRAGKAKHPEGYRWSSLGYHAQTGNTDDFLSLDFVPKEIVRMKPEERLRIYRDYVNEINTLPVCGNWT